MLFTPIKKGGFSSEMHVAIATESVKEKKESVMLFFTFVQPILILFLFYICTSSLCHYHLLRSFILHQQQ